MSSNRPYLMRAVYDWIGDNDLTPYLLVDAAVEGVRVPPQVIKNGQVVLNLAMRAVANLDLGNEWISFQARFSGSSYSIQIPVRAVLALYAQENGQGMMFPAEEEDSHPTPPPVTAVDDASPPTTTGAKDKEKPKRGAPFLRVVK
ncbi:MAG: ClpXP protease specificity-enhancing factor [Rhodanobacter sp.]